MALSWPTPASPDMWWTHFHGVFGRASTMEAAFQGYLAKHGLAPHPSVDQLEHAFQEFQVFMGLSSETDAAQPVEAHAPAPTSAQLSYTPGTPPPREGALGGPPEPALGALEPPYLPPSQGPGGPGSPEDAAMRRGHTGTPGTPSPEQAATDEALETERAHQASHRSHEDSSQ
jgi:hypothetical protein